MPVLFRERGVRFFFYAHEGKPLEPVHIHAEKDDDTAKCWLRPAVVLEKNIGFKPRDLKRIEVTITERADEIEEAWNDFFRNAGQL